ncbi:hypothetical protein NP493_246g02098 [Ridgeia piscesae]|uniref:Uncharacterized protein n=1 Tax=Ridgeia piscesae TaxID=27915 RepID=A0AAD9UD58_RIDPI|nr:hypothetical protein NP493_246g02098 [Ridgeia piscesae]
MPSSFTLQSLSNAIPQIRLTSLNICKLSAPCQPMPIASSSCHMTAISASCGLAIPCHGVIFTRNCFTLSRVKRTRLSQRRGFLLKSQPFHQPFQRTQSFPAGYCYAFCATGRCRNAACTYSHMCPTHAPSTDMLSHPVSPGDSRF